MEYLIVGLGNPGEEYKNTRHNVGRIAVSLLAQQLGVGDAWRHDALRKGSVVEAHTPHGNHVTLLLPETFMNRSGEAVRHWYTPNLLPDNLIVVHDDIDLPRGALKIVHNRGAGGHNGVISIAHTLKTRSFTRVRVGVIPVAPDGTLKKPPTKGGVHDFLLSPLTKTAMETLNTCALRAADATLAIVEQSRERAMGAYNRLTPDTHACGPV